MIERINSILNIFDVGDLKFFYLVAKKNIKNLILLSLIVSILVLFSSLNQQKKYLSKGIIVIQPDDNNIVNAFTELFVAIAIFVKFISFSFDKFNSIFNFLSIIFKEV